MSTLDGRRGDTAAGDPADAPTDVLARPQGSPGRPRPTALTAVVVLAALLALALLVDAVLGWPGTDEGLQGTERAGRILLTGWCWSLAGTYAWLATAIWTRRAATRRLAVVGAAVVATLAVFSPEAGLGAFAVVAAALLALVLAVDPALRAELVRPADPIAAARLLLGWWTGAAVYAAVFALTRAGYRSIEPSDAATSTTAGVLFFGLAGVGVGVLIATAARQGVARWVLAGAWVADAVAVGMVDGGNHAFWALLVLHATAVVALLVPARARTFFGDRPLTWTRDLGRRWGRALVESRRVVLWTGGAAVALLGLVVLLGGRSSDASSGYYADDAPGAGSSGSIVVGVLIAVLCVALAFTPTMPAWWRGGLAALGTLAVGLAVAGVDLFEDSHSTALVLLVPGVAIWCSARGAWHNWRVGATSDRPGWEGAGGPPAPAAPRFPLPPTAGGRARVQLRVESVLGGPQLLDAAVRVTAVRGNWFLVGTDRVGAGPVREDGILLGLYAGSDRCGEFRARLRAAGPRTLLVVGGMDRWTQARDYYLRFIPAGPASMKGYFAYRLYLQTVAGELVRLDPSARITFETTRENA